MIPYFTVRDALYLSNLNQQNNAAPARLCSVIESAITVLHTITLTQKRWVKPTASFSTLPWHSLVRASNFAPGVIHRSKADLHKPHANAQTMHRIYTSFLFFFFSKTEKGLQVLLSFRDEKEPVVVPYSKFHLWKEITKQCISCAFL